MDALNDSLPAALCVSMQRRFPEGLKAGFITSDGYTYLASCAAATDGIIRVPLQDLEQTNTALLPPRLSGLP